MIISSCHPKRFGRDLWNYGDDGRTFFYQYLKNGIIQKVAVQDWGLLTNGKTTRIIRLGEANYRVKVQDS